MADPDEVGLDDEHDPDGSTVGYERARVAGLIERLEHRVADLDQAAERLREGTYGLCVACGGPIGEERLEALPTTRICIDCARASAG